jgi:hypothetical protein
VVGEDIKGSLQLQRVMRALGIEPGEPAQQALVELRQVMEQQLLVNITELITCTVRFSARSCSGCVGGVPVCTTPEAFRALSKCRASS